MSHVLLSFSCKGGDFGDPQMPHVVYVSSSSARKETAEGVPSKGESSAALPGRCRPYLSPLCAGITQGGSSTIPSQPLPACASAQQVCCPLQAAPFWLPAEPLFGNGALARSGCGETAFLQHTAQMQTDMGAAKHPSTLPWFFSGFSSFLSPKIKLLWQEGEVSVLCLINQASDVIWSHSVSWLKLGWMFYS